MTPSEIRSELLKQHARLRALMAETRQVAERARRGEAVGDALQEALLLLAGELGAHNEREEALLKAVIRTVDAWGPARVEIMDEAHHQEHEELQHAILGIPSTPAEFAGAGVGVLFDRLVAHMDREEKAFLGEEVLKDDTVVVDFGG